MSLCVLDAVEENAHRQCGKRAGPSVLRRIRSPSPPRDVAIAWLTLSVRKPRSLPMRHKGALRVRALLRDASIYRPSNPQGGRARSGKSFCRHPPHVVRQSAFGGCGCRHVERCPAFPSRRLGPAPSGLKPDRLPIRRAEGGEIARRSVSAYGPPGCGEGRVPRAPSPAAAACGCAVQRALPRAPWAIHIEKAEIRPETHPEPHMCAECEDGAEGKIVLDTAREGAYYSILRQARKRLSESRGDIPRRREP